MTVGGGPVTEFIPSGERAERNEMMREGRNVYQSDTLDVHPTVKSSPIKVE
jgi:hypothetical protein